MPWCNRHLSLRCLDLSLWAPAWMQSRRSPNGERPPEVVRSRDCVVHTLHFFFLIYFQREEIDARDNRRSEEEEECWALTSAIDYRVNVDAPPSKESSCWTWHHHQQQKKTTASQTGRGKCERKFLKSRDRVLKWRKKEKKSFSSKSFIVFLFYREKENIKKRMYDFSGLGMILCLSVENVFLTRSFLIHRHAAKEK